MLHRIVAILTSNEDKSLRLKLIEDIWQEYEKQSEEFGEWTLDMELKQCGEALDAKYYSDALQASQKVIQMFKYFVENELISAVNGILKENNIKAKDIFLKTNISENGSIEISNLTLILSDIEDSFEIEKKIFEKTGINPEITVLGDNKNG
jgi:hypothetical protein